MPTPDGHAAPRNLVAATAVGLLLLAALVAALLGPRWALTALILLLVLAGAVEAARALERLGRTVHTDVLLVATVVTLVGTHVAGPRGQAVGAAVLVVGALLRPLAVHTRSDVVGTAGRTVLLGLWLPGLASYALLLREHRLGAVAVLAVVGAAALGDVGAYAVGSRVGRRPIAPSVSPNKTWEGFVGGVVLAALVVGVALPTVTGAPGPVVAALLGALVAVAAFLGDLVESMVKRDLGVKDLGHLLPGHGGVLDRVDGILLALPVGHLLLSVVAG
jgi:phosphatidate cytidylyltransferase